MKKHMNKPDAQSKNEEFAEKTTAAQLHRRRIERLYNLSKKEILEYLEGQLQSAKTLTSPYNASSQDNDM